METITSRQNPLMTHIRKLAGSAAYRRQTGQFAIQYYARACNYASHDNM